ncbi:MAG: SPFH domain-containing protein [Lachnospiraceae bacterium]|nr:SPFH domain-containing protein [Lachnospiraceae bacterium]
MKRTNVTEKILNPMNGAIVLLLIISGLLISIAVFAASMYCICGIKNYPLGVVLLIASVLFFIAMCISFAGLKIVGPNEAVVFTFFGNYYGTINKPGFFFVNPFVVSVNPAAMDKVRSLNSSISTTIPVNKKVSTKTMTLTNEKQKVNDVLGNPIIIGAVVIWNVENPTKAVFNVENYVKYLSVQCDSTIRNTARLYPYDNIDVDSEEKTLRGSSQEIADIMKAELQERVQDAGLNIQEVRITHLAYSEEIAAAMLQRQQASAVIAARQKIVEGAVSMVKMAIDQLGEEDIVVLDEERKAAMVSNLLVVLCGNKDAQPIVNSGSIY